MSYAETVLRHTLRRLLTMQALLTVAIAAAYLLVKGGGSSLAALYGGGIALLNTIISAHHLRRATDVGASDAKRGMMEIYFGAIVRFVATPVLIGLGIAALDLDPIAIIVGFALAQLGYLVNRARTG